MGIQRKRNIFKFINLAFFIALMLIKNITLAKAEARTPKSKLPNDKIIDNKKGLAWKIADHYVKSFGNTEEELEKKH